MKLVAKREINGIKVDSLFLESLSKTKNEDFYGERQKYTKIDKKKYKENYKKMQRLASMPGKNKIILKLQLLFLKKFSTFHCS